MPSQKLNTWTIYKQPKDFPSNYVARLFIDGEPTGELLVFPQIELLREIVSRNRTCIPRHPEDDPSVVETWI